MKKVLLIATAVVLTIATLIFGYTKYEKLNNELVAASEELERVTSERDIYRDELGVMTDRYNSIVVDYNRLHESYEEVKSTTYNVRDGLILDSNNNTVGVGALW